MFNSRSIRAGFTLLEVMVTCTILAGVLLLITESIDSGTHATEALNARSDVVNKTNDVVNRLSLELRYCSISSFTKTSTANTDTYTYKVATSLDKNGPVYTGMCDRILVYDRSAGTLTQTIYNASDPTAGSIVAILATDISTSADQPDGFAISEDGNLLAVNLKIEKETTSSNVQSLVWEARQAAVYMRTSLALGDGATGLSSDEDPNNDPADYPTITSDDTASGAPSTMFSYQIVADKNPTKYYVSGSLPSGVTLNSTTGLISGTPTKTGTFDCVLFAQNAAGYGTLAWTLTIGAGSSSPSPSPSPSPTPSSGNAPVVTAATVAGQQRVYLSYQVSATNMSNKYKPSGYTASGLPSGVGIDAGSGAITGTPTASGTFSATVSAINQDGTGTATITFNIAAPTPAPPVVTSASVNGNEYTWFSYTIQATHMTTQYVPPSVYTATTLPDGLTLNASTGAITGTPTLAGVYPVTVTAQNADGTGSGSLTISIGTSSSVNAPTVTGGSASGTQRASFSYAISATNMSNSYHPVGFSTSSLPAGLTLNASSGVISGIPTVNGTFSITLQAQNESGAGAGTLTLVIAPPVSAPPVVSSGSVSGTQGGSFSYQISATNMTSVYGPVGYTATGLPSGYSVNSSTGLISGSSSSAGTYSVTIGAQNADGSGSGSLSISIPSIYPVVSGGSSTGTQNSAFSYQIVATLMANKDHPVGYGASGLPSGLSVNSNSGLISGTPTTNGTFTVTLSAQNGDGTGTATLTLVINPPSPPALSNNSASGTVGTAFTYQISATNSPTSYSASNLPAGLTVNSTGLISGTPTAAGTTSVAMTATNAGGTGSATLTLTITSAPPTITFQPTKTTAPANGNKVNVAGSKIRILPPAGYSLATSSITVTASSNQLNWSFSSNSGGGYDVNFTGSVSGGVTVSVTATVTKAGSSNITNTSSTMTF